MPWPVPGSRAQVCVLETLPWWRAWHHSRVADRHVATLARGLTYRRHTTAACAPWGPVRRERETESKMRERQTEFTFGKVTGVKLQREREKVNKKRV